MCVVQRASTSSSPLKLPSRSEGVPNGLVFLLKKKLIIFLIYFWYLVNCRSRLTVMFLFQAEPLVIDLKDLFQLIFNMRKKEAESSKKVQDVFILDHCMHGHIPKLQLYLANYNSHLRKQLFLCCQNRFYENCIYSNKSCQAGHPDLTASEV